MIKQKTVSNKQKIIIALSVIGVLLLGLVACVIAIFAFPNQTFMAGVKISYKADNIQGSVTMHYQFADVGEDILWDTINFNSNDKETKNLKLLENIDKLHSANDYLLITYEFTNDGSNIYTALMNIDVETLVANNMKLEYSVDNVNFAKDPYALVVRNTESKFYYIKISPEDIAFDGEFDAAFNWLLSDYETLGTEEEIALNANNFTTSDNGATYTASYNGTALTNGQLYIPSTVGTAPVTSISSAQSSKNIKKVIVPASVENINSYAFAECYNLEEVVFEQTVIESEKGEISASSTTNGKFKKLNEGAFRNCTGLKEIILPSTTQILDRYAFYNCTALNNCPIPTGLEKIESRAFYQCSSLKEVIVSRPVTMMYCAFASCTGLTKIEINAETTLSGEAFSNCPAVEVLNVNSNITFTGYGNFLNLGLNCENSTLTFGENVTNIPSDLFREMGIRKIIFDENCKITQINEKAFYSCTLLKEVQFSNLIESLGADALYNCNSLTRVKMPSNLTTVTEAFNSVYNILRVDMDADINKWAQISFSSEMANPINSNTSLYLNGELVTDETLNSLTCSRIGSYAFEHYGLFSTLTIPNCVTSIGTGAFKFCYNVTTLNYNANITDSLTSQNEIFMGLGSRQTSCVVNIGDDVTCIPSSLFYCVSSLTSVTIGSSVELISSGAFQNTSLETLIIPNGVKTIRRDAFYYCTKLKKVEICGNVQTVGGPIFTGCKMLEEIIISSEVTTIGGYLFSSCTSLKEITIPSSVKTIESNAFRNCASLETVAFQDGITTLEADAFIQCPNLQSVYIPDTLTTATKTTFDSNANIGFVFNNKNSAWDNAWFMDPKYYTIGMTFDEYINAKGVKIGDHVYKTLPSAYLNANENDVLNVLENQNVVFEWSLNKSVTITTDLDNISIHSPLSFGVYRGYSVILGEENSKPITYTSDYDYYVFNVSGGLVINSAIIDGQNSRRCIASVSGRVTMNGGTIKNGKASLSGNESGGAIVLRDNAYLFINDGQITNCTAVVTGGAISAVGSNVEINGGEISNNSVVASSGDIKGGAISLSSRASATIHGGEIKNNYIKVSSSANGLGGAIFVDDTSALGMFDGVLENNYITKGSVALGKTSGGHILAAGLFIMYGGTIKGTNSTSVADAGGAIANDGYTYIYNCLIENCDAGFGGGIANNGNLYIAGGTITGCNSLTDSKYSNAILSVGQVYLAGGNIVDDIGICYTPEVSIFGKLITEEKYGSLTVISLEEFERNLCRYTIEFGDYEESAEDKINEILSSYGSFEAYYKDITGIDFEGLKTPYTLTLAKLNVVSYKLVEQSEFTSLYADKAVEFITYSNSLTASVSHFNLTQTTLKLVLGSGTGYNTNALYLKS